MSATSPRDSHLITSCRTCAQPTLYALTVFHKDRTNAEMFATPLPYCVHCRTPFLGACCTDNGDRWVYEKRRLGGYQPLTYIEYLEAEVERFEKHGDPWHKEALETLRHARLFSSR